MTNPPTGPEVVRRRVAEALVRSLPFTTTLSALLFGVVVGAVLRGWFQPPVHTIEYVETASLAALQRECTPLVRALDAQITLTAADVESLAGRLALNDGTLAIPGPHPHQEYEARDKLSAQLDLSAALLAKLVEQRVRVAAERGVPWTPATNPPVITSLLSDRRTGEVLDLPIVESWLSFVTSSRAAVCGDRRSDANLECQAALLGELARLKVEYVECARKTGPALALLGREAAGARADARPLGTENPLVNQWSVVLCAE
jgi:hypothetical protein